MVRRCVRDAYRGGVWDENRELRFYSGSPRRGNQTEEVRCLETRSIYSKGKCNESSEEFVIAKNSRKHRRKQRYVLVYRLDFKKTAQTGWCLAEDGCGGQTGLGVWGCPALESVLQ